VKNMPVFDKFKPGKVAQETGVYLCEGCGEIIALAKGERLPPCRCGSPTWILVAIAGEAGKKYKSGMESPESGLFICTNCKNEIIPIAKGDTLPPCKKCGGNEWQIILRA